MFPFLSSFLVYFPVNISLMFMFRWKAIAGGFGNTCCRLLLFMRAHPFVTAFLRFLRRGLYLVMYTRGILLFFGLSAKRLFLSCSRASLKYWSISWILYPLSISLVLKLARADFKLSGSELVRILEMTVPFMNPRKTESGCHDVR